MVVNHTPCVPAMAGAIQTQSLRGFAVLTSRAVHRKEQEFNANKEQTVEGNGVEVA